MPDDKDQIPKPDERPEEKKYSLTSLTIFKNLAIFKKAVLDKIP